MIISSALVLIICAIISIYLYAVDYVLKITVLENKIKYSQANNQTDNKTDENIINIDELKATTTNQ
ncbi:MAG: hypothetical protein QM532_02430 [Cyanobium sp. MAG06]|nr:hypothetical protein [Cyanobium sp. MAG06]